MSKMRKGRASMAEVISMNAFKATHCCTLSAYANEISATLYSRRVTGRTSGLDGVVLFNGFYFVN